jgi:putative secretion ATPase (PEP-CTERM system associated)
MYEAFYGLTCKPFQLNPDPSFYFSSKPHRRAKAYLEYGVQRNEGFIVITGEVGAGKTTIVRGLLANLDASKVVAANLVTTQLGAEDTLRMVGSAFGVPVKGLSKSDLLMALEAFLVQQTSQGRRCLLIVDEAQNLNHRAVEELRMLSNFQLGQQALLQTFLVGQPEFRAILQSPDMQQLRQRVTATCHIGPLDQEETQGYILHRLKCAGATDRPTFDAAAFESNEIVGELNAETGANDNKGRTSKAAWGDSGFQTLGAAVPLDIDLGAPQITPGLARAISKELGRQGVEQYDARLRRMEGSMLRLERINLEVLVILQKMVEAMRQPDPGTPQ